MFVIDRGNGTEICFSWGAYICHETLELPKGCYNVVIDLQDNKKYWVGFESLKEANKFSAELKNSFEAQEGDKKWAH